MMQPLSIAFVWHMHQPFYRDLATGRCSMPWVRLHAAKDYLDMVKRLESFPGIHQTFNIVPSLIDQLEAYLSPTNGADDFLALSERPPAELSDHEQRFLLEWFFLANVERMIKPYPRYHDLLAKRGLHVNEADWPSIQKRFQPQDYLDLQTWFNLAWIDPWLRRQDQRLAALEAKGGGFTEEEKRSVLDCHRRLIAQIIPAYRNAAARGQIELTTSPYYHPILPLLCDLRCAHAALPELPLPPDGFRHPEDARQQLAEALKRHEVVFGQTARGIWPPEGSVSEQAAALAIEAKIRWMATDEIILWRTLGRARSPALLYRPHAVRQPNGELAVIFRDRELSDLIGFTYSAWKPDAAVSDFVNRLGVIHQEAQSFPHPALVSIILDGENAWEFYPDDGHEFLMQLYEALARDDRFRCVTVSEFLDQHPLADTPSLPPLFSGSWIDGNFATWIGHPEKNAAWSHLSQAREALGTQGREEPSLQKAWDSLGAAEGSDWMWWFGDTHFSAQADEFDRLFRMHVANTYRLAGQPVPETLAAPIRRQIPIAQHDPTDIISPTIDGVETSYYEWLYAGVVDLRRQYAAIQRSEQYLQSLRYGFNRTHYFIRLDPNSDRFATLRAWTIELELADAHIRLMWDGSRLRAALGDQALPSALERILELAIPAELIIRPAAVTRLPLKLSLLREGEILEQHPAQGTFQVLASSNDLTADAWSA